MPNVPPIGRLAAMIAGLALSTAAVPAPSATVATATVTERSAVITARDCVNLVQHHPDPDVAYRPGVDVHGQPVVPADLPDANTWHLPPEIQFTLKVNPFARPGFPAGATGDAGAGADGTAGGPADRFANSAIPIARIQVDLLSGTVSIDGKPADATTTDAVLTVCRSRSAPR